jgi:iron complex transport system substrate-binding protein
MVMLCVACSRDRSSAATGEVPCRPRIVSLSPPLTETLGAIGAGDLLVGISDFCPTQGKTGAVARVGSAISPSYERIARLRPSLIVSEATITANPKLLGSLARTELLPWLTLEQAAGSVRSLGRLSARVDAADRLAAELERQLGVPARTESPAVLLVIANGPTLGEIFFVRDNSLHGAALRAAGARNAVPQPVHGVPRVSLEALLELDPPNIIVLALPRAKARDQLLEPWRKLGSLTAVRTGHLGAILAPDVFSTGPAILDLVARLRGELRQLGLVAGQGVGGR